MRESDAAARYAIYWVPPEESALSRLGAAWLGRDAATDRPFPRPAIAGFAENALVGITAEPRRYGLHATLKPPFRLVTGSGPAALEEELRAFAAGTAPVIAPALKVARIGRFLALVPAAPAAAVVALAQACVERFDRYRAPPPPEELARRRAAGLTPAQEAKLLRWGYPYVMDEFRFHVSLTGPIERAMADRLLPALTALFAPVLATPIELREIALFVEPEPGAPFRLRRRFGLSGELTP